MDYDSTMSIAESSAALDEAISAYGLDDVFRRFAGAGVVWAFPRFTEQVIASFRDGPDVDLWVSRKSFSTASKVLEDAGFRLAGGSTRPGGSMLIRYKSPVFAEAPVLEIHVGDYWYRFRCLLSEQDLSLHLHVTDRTFLSDLNLFILGTVRPAGRGRLFGERLDFARKVWRSNQEPSFRSSWRAYAEDNLGKSAVLLERILESDNGNGRTQALIFSSAFFMHSSDRLSYFFSGAQRRTRKRWTAFFGRKVVVSALGVDGAGKSSLLAGLQHRLEADDFRVEYIYGGRTRENSRIVHLVRQVIFWFLPSFRNKDELRPAGGPAGSSVDASPGNLLKWGSLVAYTFDYWIRFGRVAPEKGSGARIALVDRGPDDFVTISLPRRAVRFFQYLSPRRHLVLWCDAPTDVIWARKKERSPDDIALRQELYRRHVAKPLKGQMALRVDTSGPEAVSVALAYRAVRLALMVRSGLLDRGLFNQLLASDGTSSHG